MRRPWGEFGIFEQVVHQEDQLPHHGGAWRRGFGDKGLAEGGEHGGVNRAGLGEFARGTGGIDDADGDLGRVQRGDDGALVAVGGFANDVATGDGRKAFEQLRCDHWSCWPSRRTCLGDGVGDRPWRSPGQQ